MASLHLGPDEEKISQLTGLTLEEVKIRGDRLRENGVWKENKVCLSSGNEQTFDVELILCILCADGSVTCKREILPAP